jgi:hypothetical protein
MPINTTGRFSKLLLMSVTINVGCGPWMFTTLVVLFVKLDYGVKVYFKQSVSYLGHISCICMLCLQVLNNFVFRVDNTQLCFQNTTTLPVFSTTHKLCTLSESIFWNKTLKNLLLILNCKVTPDPYVSFTGCVRLSVTFSLALITHAIQTSIYL